MIINLRVAETQLSNLIDRAMEGEDVVITRGSEPVAKLVALKKAEPQRRPGSMKGELVVPDEFFDPLPADELARWEQ
ncbi:MAG TPA: type II toxin-antitoxin system prevent-host-death family antitoxin [Longimicrobium sp.]|nr:type II toxin-antitoxin system prevent-host-death family antitoxin [Longimicrobium sp.]